MTDRELQDLREQLRAKMQQAGTLRPLSKAQRDERRERARQDKAYFLRTYCPHYFPHEFSARHRDVLAHCDLQNLLYFLTAFRGWGKSACASFGDVLYKIYEEQRHFFLIISNTEDMAEPFVNALKMEIEENPRLLQDFGKLQGSRTWTTKEFITKNDRKVLGRGIFQPFRGLRHGPYRPDDVTLDDVETDQTTDNPDQTRKIQKRIWKAVRPALQRKKDGGYTMKWVGTPITDDCVTAQFMADTERTMVKDIIPILTDQGESAWPEIYDDAEIDTIRRDDFEAWFSEYLLQPLPRGDREFQEEWFHFVESLPEFVPGDITYGACDPSFGQVGDFKTVITLTGQRRTMNIYVRHAYIKKGAQGTPKAMCKAIDDQGKLYDCDHAVEENSLKDFLWEAVENYEKDNAVHLRVHGVNHGPEASKQDRIRRLISPMERKKIFFQKGHSDQDILVQQFRAFPKGHDDGPDAMEEAYQQVMRRLKQAGRTEQLQTFGQRDTSDLDLRYTNFEGYC